VHELSSSRRSRLSAHAGKIALTLGVCLCAGQLVATPASASPLAVAPATTATASVPVTLAAAAKPAAKTVTKKKVISKSTKVLNEARKHRGKRYRYGASGPKAFDCSGFTLYVFRKSVGKKLPHKANSQQRYGRAVSRAKKKVGDLIVFRRGSYGYHAAIYAGGGYMYDAPKPGKRVGKRKMWGSNYVVRRLV
jgi:cell wall-associated NlpC family hydrolase